MSNDWRTAAFEAAVRMVEGGPPRNLVARAQPEADERGAVLTTSDLTEVIAAADEAGLFLSRLGMQIHKWDARADEEWTEGTEGTEASTPQRRAVICRKLGIDQDGEAALLVKRPIFRDETLVIAAPWEPWYTPERAAAHEFYWPRYRDYLLAVRGWPTESVTSLDLATSQVVERLADPTRTEAHPAKGLVVGYVQSGKTANFTGVVAKAIDAGYRLVIVMTGTIEMLRAQTQRRMDMEMVGRQNILGDLSPSQAMEARVDYQQDDDWLTGRFADLGADRLRTEITRLTQHHKDYQKQFRTLRMERVEPSRPLYDPENLFRTGARLAIVKKNAAVLKKLVTDITANRKAFAEIPVLIIDDESDQASVNTIDPEKVRKAKDEGLSVKERRAINERIASMLELMPRAQYVGYTATPFANVFADPSDPLGIFPKDFVIGLSRPPAYMGIEDFHDLDEFSEAPRTVATSNARAFVRELQAMDDEQEVKDSELSDAVDMFVLTGAVKLFRESVYDNRYRHHTMLVHDSVRTMKQKELADRVRDIWESASFAAPAGKRRLRALYEKDLLPVSEARLEPGVPAPPDFETLAPFVAQAVGRITEHGQNPVIVVNSDTDVQQQQQALDFDRHSTWRILVGGAKLSRGFTVEGLTISYFRRAANMSDSLTQMGRWFGFRPGYRDLVRLYIARRAKFGAKAVDLYAAFESVARDEAAFRKQLAQYAEWEDGKPRILPIQIPPLVSQHLPWLQPTARNKMFNAVLEEQSEQPFTPTGYANHPDLLMSSLDIWRPILAAADERIELPQGGAAGSLSAFVGRVSAVELVEAAARTSYLPLYLERTVLPKITFYRRLIADGLLDEFVILLPQPASSQIAIAGVGERSVIARERRGGRGGKFGEVTDPKHRRAPDQFVRGNPPAALTDLCAPTRGAVLVYLVKETEPDFEAAPEPAIRVTHPERGVVVAFSSYVPHSALASQPHVLRFRVHNPDREAEATVDVA